MKRLAVLVAAALASLTGCTLPFFHSDTSLNICSDLGWGHSLCGTSLCSDYWNTNHQPCPDEIRYGGGPR